MKWEYEGSAGHGGMYRDLVTASIVFAFFETSSYVSSGNGPASPGRWQGAQFLKMMGAMSSLKVGFDFIVEDWQADRRKSVTKAAKELQGRFVTARNLDLAGSRAVTDRPYNSWCSKIHSSVECDR